MERRNRIRRCAVVLAVAVVASTGIVRSAAAQVPVDIGEPVPIPGGESTEEPTFNLTIAPLGLALGGLRTTLSLAPASVLSIDLSALYVAPLLVPFHAAGGELRLTFWPSDPYDGFFIGPMVQVSHTFPADSLLMSADGFYGATTVAPGLYLGYRWLWSGGFNLGLGGGAGYGFMVDHDPVPDCPSGYTCSTEAVGGGFTWFLLFDLGYAW